MSGRTRYIWSDRAGQLLPEADWLIEEAMHRNKVGLQVVSDISEPVVSPVDGSVLSSRADVREHNIRNGVEDVGNDPAYRHPTRPQPTRESAAPMIAELLREERPIRRGYREEE